MSDSYVQKMDFTMIGNSLFFRFFCFCVFCTTALFPDNPSVIALVIGTRPEAIKVIPLYLELKKQRIDVDIIYTGQHKEMVQDVFDLFEVDPHFNLQVMQPRQDLFYLTGSILEKIKHIYATRCYSCVVVQGDTTSAYAAALGAFYLNIPVVHLEAGLRSGCLFRPFPEEAYRQMISRITALHLAPTVQAKYNLIKENVDPNRIYVVGNTVVDALRLIKEKISNLEIKPSEFLLDFFKNAKMFNKTTFLLTVHRRESLEGGLFDIFSSIKELLLNNKNISILYPIHPNPKIKSVFEEVFKTIPERLCCCNALSYYDLVYSLQNVDGVLTDSGGVQEEAVSLNKPTLVLREETDRPEAIEAGKALLVGTHQNAINNGVSWVLKKMESNLNANDFIYGDGFSANKAAELILDFINANKEAF